MADDTIGEAIGSGIRTGFGIGFLFVTVNIISTWVLPVFGVKGESMSSWSRKKSSEVL